MRKEEAKLLMKKEEELISTVSQLKQRIARLKEGISDARDRVWNARYAVKSSSLWAHLDHGFDFDTQDNLREGSQK